MNIYLFIVVPAMAIMCGLCLWIIVGDIRAIWRSMSGEKYESIRHRGVKRSYGNAAIIVGGACLFLGEPKECEELCDDLWHRGVKAEVLEHLTGEEVFNVL